MDMTMDIIPCLWREPELGMIIIIINLEVPAIFQPSIAKKIKKGTLSQGNRNLQCP